MIEEMNKTGVEARHLKKYYPVKGNQNKALKALDDVSLSIPRGKIFGVVGESGCGKSTLGRCLLRLIQPTDGQIFFDGKDISTLTKYEFKKYQNQMQMIFQNPYSSFNPKLKLGYSLREVCHIHHMSREETEADIKRFLEYISLPTDILSRMPGELSGGQLQRLAIARALLLKPEFIVADEPVSALDVSVQAQILNLIMDLREVFSMTMLFISHDMTVVEYLCDYVAVMYLGTIVEMGKKEEIFKNILHPYTKALLSAVPKNDPDETKNRIMLKGDVPSAMDEFSGCRFVSRCPDASEQCKKSAPELKEMTNGHRVACHLYDNIR